MKKRFFNKSGVSQAQSLALACAFVAEHKELFEQWIEEKKRAKVVKEVLEETEV